MGDYEPLAWHLRVISTRVFFSSLLFFESDRLGDEVFLSDDLCFLIPLTNKMLGQRKSQILVINGVRVLGSWLHTATLFFCKAKKFLMFQIKVQIV